MIILSAFPLQPLEFLSRPVLHCSVPITARTPSSPERPSQSQSQQQEEEENIKGPGRSELEHGGLFVRYPTGYEENVTCSSTFFVFYLFFGLNMGFVVTPSFILRLYDMLLLQFSILLYRKRRRYGQINHAFWISSHKQLKHQNIFRESS